MARTCSFLRWRMAKITPISLHPKISHAIALCRRSQCAATFQSNGATMLGRLNHVALVVPNLEQACATYSIMLGATLTSPQALPEHGVTVVFIDVGNTKIELLEPLGENSPIQAFLDKTPSGGMHHLCYEVGDILAARDHLISEGARILGDGNPKIGAHGRPVLFLHPKDFMGTLIELEEV